jgi:hypothetical protein
VFSIASEAKITHNFWVLTMPITWIYLILFAITFIILQIYKHTIVRFNNWLDK